MACVVKSGRPWEIGGPEDHLLVLLLYYRCHVTQEFIGFFCRVDRSVICRAIQRIEALVLRTTVERDTSQADAVRRRGGR